MTCTATDAAGNTDDCSFTVTVTTESVPPQALCTDVTVDADANCEADASIDNGSYDPDGGAVTLVQDPPGPYPLGQTIVQLIVTDNEGVESSCSAVVTAEDNTPPVAHCSVDINVSIPTGQPGAIVNFSSAADDNCPGATISCDPPSGSLFPAGPTTVTCTATDAAGNTDECSFTVTVTAIFTNPPVAVDDHKSTHSGGTLYVVGAGVLVNDYDADGDPLTAVLNTGVSVGALTLNADGSFMYLPPVDYEGPVEFTYYANDGLVNSVSPATVCITVKLDPFVVADFNQDGFIDALDLGAEIDALFIGGANPRSPNCNVTCADFDCSGFPDMLDLSKLIDHIFVGGSGPCDPCGQ